MSEASTPSGLPAAASPKRRKGFGKVMMSLAEKEAQKLGAKRLGLHVFGFNEAAIRLYQSLGYATTDLVMEKRLNPA